MSETTTPLLIQLADDEREALRVAREGHTVFRAEGSTRWSEAQMARLLLRDALIGLGLLKLPRANRARGARRTRD